MNKKQKEIQEKIDSGEYIASKYLSSDASETDKIKYNICQKICKIHNDGLSLKELSILIDCDVITAKLIVYSHYDKFSLEFLLETYKKASIGVKSS